MTLQQKVPTGVIQGMIINTSIFKEIHVYIGYFLPSLYLSDTNSFMPLITIRKHPESNTVLHNNRVTFILKHINNLRESYTSLVRLFYRLVGINGDYPKITKDQGGSLSGMKPVFWQKEGLTSSRLRRISVRLYTLGFSCNFFLVWLITWPTSLVFAVLDFFILKRYD